MSATSTSLVLRQHIPQSPYLELYGANLITRRQLKLIQQVWLGNQTCIREILEADPDAIHIYFDGKVISSAVLNPEKCGFKQWTLLHLACFLANEKVAVLLMSAAPFFINYEAPRTLNRRDSYGTPLFLLARHVNDAAGCRLFYKLLEAGAGIEPFDPDGTTILHKIAEMGKERMLQITLDYFSREERNRIPSILMDNFSLPNEIGHIVASYCTYLSTPFLQKICQSESQYRVTNSRTTYLIYDTPLSRTIENLSLMRGSTSRLIRIAKMLLEMNCSLESPRSKFIEGIRELKFSKKTNFSLRQWHLTEFPKGWFDRLIANVGNQELMNELQAFHKNTVHMPEPKDGKCIIL